jgi:hypothetical protein
MANHRVYCQTLSELGQKSLIAVGKQVSPNGPPMAALQTVACHSPFPRLRSVAIYMHDLAGGGVERQTITLAQELQAAGLSVILVLHQMRGELRGMIQGSIPLVDLNSRRTLHDIPLLARFLRRERPSVLISNLDHKSQHLNNRFEQDHRGVKGRYGPMRGFKSPGSAGEFCRADNELRNFLRPRSRTNQQVSADYRRFHFLRRTATVLSVLEAA